MGYYMFVETKETVVLVITWAVTTSLPTLSKTVVICQGRNREDAKHQARADLKGDPGTYIVQPLTRPEDKVVLKLNIEGVVG